MDAELNLVRLAVSVRTLLALEIPHPYDHLKSLLARVYITWKELGFRRETTKAPLQLCMI